MNAYLHNFVHQLGGFLEFSPDVNGRCVETITLGALLVSAPDVIRFGRQTITVSHRKTIAETIMFTIADCPFLFIPFANVN